MFSMNGPKISYYQRSPHYGIAPTAGVHLWSTNFNESHQPVCQPQMLSMKRWSRMTLRLAEECYQNEHTAVESITDGGKRQGLRKNTPMMPTSDSICKESHQNEYAAVESITDEEKWHGLRKKYTTGAHLCQYM